MANYISKHSGSEIDKVVDEAVLFTEQSLTEEQQAQVRENINAQNKLMGANGQVVGFGADGTAIAQDLDLNGIEVSPSEPDSPSEGDLWLDTDDEELYSEFLTRPENSTEGMYLSYKNGEWIGVDNTPRGNFFGIIGLNWETDSVTGVKYQMVPIDGVTASMDLGRLDCIMTHPRTTEGYSLFVEEQNQFLEYITNGDAETVDGGVKFYIYGDSNTVEIPFGLVVG